MQSWTQPTQEQIEQVIVALAHPAQRRYFFDKLDNPEWITPLTNAGFFKNTPAAGVDASGNIIQCPPWPESKYLAKVAAESPQKIYDIFMALDIKNNTTVFADLIESAAKIPQDLTIRMMNQKVIPWIEKCDQIPFNICENILQLFEHLIAGQKSSEAFKLFQIVFEVLPDKKEFSDNFLGTFSQPRARLDPWQYEVYINKAIELLHVTEYKELIAILVSMLNKALHLAAYEKPHDNSYIWRPAIEEHKQNIRTDIINVLITVIRNSTEKLIQINNDVYTPISSHLLSKEWHIFIRLAIHLARKNPKRNSDSVATFLTNRSYFESAELRHEFGLLLDECFNLLAEADKDTILNWMKEGPSEDYKQKFGDEAGNQEEKERFKRKWQLKQLALFHANLPQEWQNIYRKLVEEFGEPKHPDFAFYSTTTIGDESPKIQESLKEMSISELVDYLASWQPKNEFDEPSKEGLSRTLQGLIANEPDRYYDLLKKCTLLEPIYTRALFSGYHGAIKQNKMINWDILFAACLEMVLVLREFGQKETLTGERDPGRRQADMRIADIVDAAFEKETDLDQKFRDIIWQIIELLTDDPDPSADSEIYGSTSMDPSNRSLNVVRGQALHAAIKYALWVRRHLESRPDSAEQLGKGFDTMPEVRRVLEIHLDINNDPALAIRSVYGQWFPWLVLIDEAWATKYADQIFPETEELEKYFLAAWYAFISFSKAYKSSFIILSQKYRKAISLIGNQKAFKNFMANPDEELAKHLMQLYWEGQLENGLNNDLLQSFWQKADAKLTAFAVQFVGLTLGRTEGTIETAILNRLTAFWQDRLDINSPAETRNIDELSNFCYWFASEKFDAKWSIEMLQKCLDLGALMIPQMHAIERLTELSTGFPADALKCLDRLIRNDLQPMLISFWTKQIRTIITNAFNLMDADISNIAEKLVHHLGSKQFYEFRDLLPE